MSNLLSSDWDKPWTETIDGKYSRDINGTTTGNYGERLGVPVSECRKDCDTDDACISVSEDRNTPGGKCWRGRVSKDHTKWMNSANNHQIYFKNKTNMKTDLVDVKVLYGSDSQYSDVCANCRSGDMSFSKDYNGNSCPGLMHYDYYLGANGTLWGHHRGEYGCPKIGIISGGEDLRVQSCTGTVTANKNSLVNGKAKCHYQKMYNPSDTLPPGYTASTLADLDRYFSGVDLVKARQSWCMGASGVAGFDNMMKNSGCTTRDNGFDYLLLLADLLPDDWYDTKENCDRFILLGERVTQDYLSQLAKDKINYKINLLPDGTRWSSDVIRTLNKFMLDDDISSDIKKVIEDKTKKYCNTIDGSDKEECSCFNAIEGFESNKNGGDGCTKGEKGCDDVKLFFDIKSKLGRLDSSGGAVAQFSATFNPNRDAQACVTGHTANDNTILAYKPKEVGEPRVIQVCSTVIEALDQATLSILGGVNVVCNQHAEAVSSYNQGNSSGGGGGGDDEEEKKSNIWIWVLIAICSFIILIGVGGSLFFLL
jgi:hypothetical protein